MGVENFKLLVRNLRKGNHAKLKIRSAINPVKFRKIGKCISIQTSFESDNSGEE